MIEIAITKMSSKGQVVIPVEMRKDFKEGEKLAVIKDHEQIVLKKAHYLDKKLKGDLEFSRRIREAWKRYDEGKFKSASAEEFLKMLEKC